MKRKLLVTILSLTMGLSVVACGSKVPQEEATETTEAVATAIESEIASTEALTEQEGETSETEETTTTEETPETREIATSGSKQPYYSGSTLCGNAQKWQAWDDFCTNWNESNYGTTTKGKSKNDFPYYGSTGYDGSLIEERTTDKGYKVLYDTATGRVYYTGMVLPTGNGWDDIESGGILANYEISKGYNNFYDVTYAEMQEVLGVYNGD